MEEYNAEATESTSVTAIEKWSADKAACVADDVDYDHPGMVVHYLTRGSRSKRKRCGVVIGFLELDPAGNPVLKIGWSLCCKVDTFDKNRAIAIAYTRAAPIESYLHTPTKGYPAAVCRIVKRVAPYLVSKYLFKAV